MTQVLSTCLITSDNQIDRWSVSPVPLQPCQHIFNQETKMYIYFIETYLTLQLPCVCWLISLCTILMLCGNSAILIIHQTDATISIYMYVMYMLQSRSCQEYLCSGLTVRYTCADVVLLCMQPFWRAYNVFYFHHVHHHDHVHERFCPITEVH